MTRRSGSAKARRRGSSLIEFALVAVLLCLMLLVFVDFGRLFLVYNSVANSARAGLRYAIVHGNDRTGSGADGPSGPADNPPEVISVVKNFADSAPLDRSRLNVTVTYPDGSNIIGALVQITVDYPYDPLLGYFPLDFNLRARSQGRIVF
jgi:hypothetical protein